MASSILHPPSHLPPATALQLSQQAPELLATTPSAIAPYSVGSLFASAETPELWTTYENLLLSCLRTGDDQSAHLCLERLQERFGPENERLMAMRGLFQEAIADTDAALQRVLEKYDSILESHPSNMPIAKRRIALLKSMGKVPESITALTKFLDSSPTDAEAWAELAELYVSQGMYQQGIFALEEVLLIAPNAWNIHARLGEVLFVAASSFGSGDMTTEKYLPESLRRFCRSVELCDDYLRGYYGLKLTSSRILASTSTASRQSKSEEGYMPLDIKAVQLLNQTATAKLAEIVRRSAGGEFGWKGYDLAEVTAARALLDRDTSAVAR